MFRFSFRRFSAHLVAVGVIAGFIVGSHSQIVQAADGPATTQVAIGQSHVVAAATNGTVWTWGSIVPGPSGTGSKFSFPSPVEVRLPSSRKAIDVAASRESSIALATDGTVWAWGYLGMGLGDVSQTVSSDYLNPLQVSFGSTRIASIAGGCEGYIAVDTNGEVWQWGSFWGVWNLSVSRPIKVPGVADAVVAARSCSSAYAVLSDGSVKSWGSNGGGRLGDGTIIDRSTPVSVSLPSGRKVATVNVSDTHVLALATDGTLWGWGSNSQSQLAADPAVIAYSSSPRRVLVPGASGSFRSIATTQSTPSSMAVMSSGEIWEWGTWSQTDFYPKKRNQPTTDLGSTQLIDGSLYNNNMVFVGNDGSLWSRSTWSGNIQIDGNCGLDSSDYTQWVNGQVISPRYLVRVISNGQFGPEYKEDRITARSLTTATGANLPLDGSGTAVGKQGNHISITLSGPASACYATSSLSISFDFNGDGVFETSGVDGTDDSGTTTSTGTYLLDWSGRRKGSVKITNWDGISKTYSFWMGIAVAAGSGGGGEGGLTSLPQVETSTGTSLAVGTDGYLYGWGKSSPIIGGASTIPTRLFADNNTQFTKVDIDRSRKNVSAVGAALKADGEIVLWGQSPNRGIFFDVNGSRVNSSADWYTVRRPIGVTRWIDFVIDNCDGPYLKLVGDDQQLYIHGLSSTSCLGSTSSIPEIPSSAAGLQISKISNGLFKSTDGWVDLPVRKIRQCCGAGPDPYTWVLPPTLTVAAADTLPSRSAVRYAVGTCTEDYPMRGVQISSTGQLELVTRRFLGASCFSSPPGRGVLTETARTNISNWTTRTAVAISMPTNRWSNNAVIIASDGSIWDYFEWSPSPLVRRDLDPRMATPKRFSGEYVVTSDSALWAMNRSDPWNEFNSGKYGTTYGNCGTTKSNDELASVRVFSTGQFGTSFTEDRFAFQIDAVDRFDNSQWEKQSYPGRSNDWGTTGFPILTVRPTSSLRLYGYVTSSCFGGSITSASWDMNDDGEYETTANLESVEVGATKMATELRDRFDTVTYAGFGNDWKQIRTPEINLSVAGGRYIGLKLTTPYGTQMKRFAVRVQPQKPVGYIGVSVNSAARFTDSADVNLDVIWPEGATTALVSNDGGFSDAQLVPLTSKMKWKLDASGSGLLTSVVYVRFLSVQPDYSTGSWINDEMSWYQVSDDIILDLSAPEVSGVSAVANESNGFTSQFVSAMNVKSSGSAEIQYATVSLRAVDAASGIAGMQVAADPAVPGPIRPYSSQVRIPVDRERVAVRVKDNVGHWSPWNFARVSGFVPISETPATPPVENPTTPTPPEVPSIVPPPKSSGPQSGTEIAPSTPSVSVKTSTVSTTARLVGTSARVTVSIPSSIATTCTIKTVKGKKTKTCKPATVVVSTSSGVSTTFSAKKGSNSVTMSKVKKGTTITVKVAGKVVSRVKVK